MKRRNRSIEPDNMSSWRRPFGRRPETTTAQEVDEGEVTDGSLHYVVEKGGNDSQPSYQEATGAPVEVNSPLGYNVGAVTIIFLNISKMVGTGVYSTRKSSASLQRTPSTHTAHVSDQCTAASIYRGTGSVGLSMIYWVLGFFTSVSSLSVYLEYASYFPNRSGSEVVYLEQAYPRPRWFFPTAFAVQSVIFSFSSSNAIGKHPWTASSMNREAGRSDFPNDSACSISIPNQRTRPD